MLEGVKGLAKPDPLAHLWGWNAGRGLASGSCYRPLIF